MKVKITKTGPYIVSGGVPLHEKIITPVGGGYKLTEGKLLPQAETYSLCRCGRSANAPFCDGSHMNSGFIGIETASRSLYKDRAELIEGYSVDLMDDGRCAFFRFCHTDEGSVWQLTEESDTVERRDLAIKTAGECFAGRLVSVSKSGEELEPELKPEIDIIQDPERGVSAGIFVAGGIPIESCDGHIYEIRNRVALCRCGRSNNKPFCDATHVGSRFKDK